ncbi:MAG: radical SAM family heme chaperone HemW [Clostridia bacterium]|nr:radical SAM family heme chaperone HemW [Clostridia bacterium]
MQVISLYIHIPLCVKKCAYCDFASFAGRMAHRDRYVQAVCREIRAQAAFFGKRSLRSVFFGGGTPTLLTGAQIRAIMDTVRECFALLPDAEISMEGNPGTLTRDNLKAYRAAGVNRLSLGVQSMDDGLLAAIGRIHTAAQAEEAAAMAREAGFDNLNLDLMYGLPGQSAAQWRETLQKAIALSPEHLSCYSLILEEGTPLYEAVQAGMCAALPCDNIIEEMDGITARLTRENGYAHYEVSNYARPGRTCRHNVVYWECEPYLGVGLGAHSDVDGRRFYNPEDWEAYLEMAESGETARQTEGENRREDRMFERMMMGLRQVQGVDMARFEQDFSVKPEDVWPETLERMTNGGMMEKRGSRLRLTERGMQVMNGVLVELMDEFDSKQQMDG